MDGARLEWTGTCPVASPCGDRIMSILKIGGFILLAPVIAYMLFFLLPAAPVFFGMALFIGFVIGPIWAGFILTTAAAQSS